MKHKHCVVFFSFFYFKFNRLKTVFFFFLEVLHIFVWFGYHKNDLGEQKRFKFVHEFHSKFYLVVKL